MNLDNIATTSACHPNTCYPISISAVPKCTNDARVVVVSSQIQETLELSCTMRSIPRKILDFRWTLNTSTDETDIPKAQYSEHGSKSLLTYTTRTRMDYGVVECRARNKVGVTDEKPCVFKIVPEGTE